MTKVKIVYASVTGNDEEIADILDEKFQELGVETDVSEIFQTDVTDFSESDICIIATYTYDQGIVPDEALDFYEDMQETDLTGKIYGVTGSGDHYYKEFCSAVNVFEQTFINQGAIKGAESVKIELEPNKEDIEKLDKFAESIYHKFQERN